MLTTGTWKITAIMTDNDGNGSYEFDTYQLIPACGKDNFLTFKTNGELDTDEVAIAVGEPMVGLVLYSFHIAPAPNEPPVVLKVNVPEVTPTHTEPVEAVKVVGFALAVFTVTFTV